MGVMTSKADAIVIGSGALGAATAYYLSERKRLSVVLIDKHDIGSQTSPRAAGMVSCARKSDLMISLIKGACRKIEAFTKEAGQPLDWVHSGCLKIARRPKTRKLSRRISNAGVATALMSSTFTVRLGCPHREGTPMCKSVSALISLNSNA
jgi:4-methylaminobutanoate oxidase (formaldehyde-forming)